ncbi:hypothetical protein LPTSP3_g16200 [Leptospira kobayashii]|uniref:Uncharacterized protein n=1 Tax=Leptospira kobayashii TaxID=1917830 RepID=A0ABN6KFJ4_9LEPT|nr:hypothetical protein [Leptospira kobayashii]BDA78690.1 hypothetical protein LPTSP3_g16200 [Leptospira kobayashii]
MEKVWFITESSGGLGRSLAESENPPLRLALGKDAVEMIRRNDKTKSEEKEK